jgi:hypothetical protein
MEIAADFLGESFLPDNPLGRDKNDKEEGAKDNTRCCGLDRNKNPTEQVV